MYIHIIFAQSSSLTLRCPLGTSFNAMDVNAGKGGTFTPRRAAKYLDVPLDAEEAPSGPGWTW